MHELSIASSLVDTIRDRTGERTVASVHLRIGQLSGVLADALRFSFEIAAANTALEGAELILEQPAGRIRCRTYGLDSGLVDQFLLCACGSADVQVTAGRELDLVAVQLAAVEAAG
ncbi:hydrogenase maturation nickel metallochaperone HypA [Cryobacterium melibiosiphilum]|uniref:Hydrogenase maturation factor HypA n=1 Tax=Cryobacterium melibiosiphilum TaxID=995039 RepID=A0A3A5MQZ4_9MICO|nr:hydrogenase maturation nickel metallochaperone HypA [Cryobacterium melibiosiphilum]RJT88661.1 hydrogenase maturation nickel metallochaperone HypA [Cryobacterium melibiosiphilum]RJT89423.1 hydrogenase maturation nickel metallochaperone HypA [Cryobacterium melibiosiphilum]